MPTLAYSEAKKGEKVRLTFIEDFMLSGTAAVTSKTIAAPIERVKMVIQTQGAMLKAGTLDKPFTGIGDCFGWIMKNEGFAAFWRSNFTNCLRYFPTQALNFSFKGRIKKIEQFKVLPTDTWQKYAKNIASGGLAGGLCLCFVYSLDYARTKLASDLKGEGGKRQYSGLIDVYRQTLKTDGFVGLYRGFNISFVGIFVYRGFYFGLYDSVMPNIPAEYANAGTKFVLGYIVTVVAGLMSYPIDTIRRRMMMTSGLSKAEMYTSAFDCFGKIVKAEGAASLMKGAGANILRGIAGAGVLAGFDELKAFYVLKTYGTTEFY
jgi:solute carrier family 25 (adenine nucleotide translocator) protein 4/5/6/31